MIGDEDVEGTDFGKEAHFINSHHNGIDYFVLEGFKDDCPVLYSEFDCSGFGSVLNDAATDSLMSENGDNVTVSTGTVAFHLSQEGFLQ